MTNQQYIEQIHRETERRYRRSCQIPAAGVVLSWILMALGVA